MAGGGQKEDQTQKALEKQELKELQEEQARQKEQDLRLEQEKLQALKGISRGGAGGLFTGSGLSPSTSANIPAQKLG